MSGYSQEILFFLSCFFCVCCAVIFVFLFCYGNSAVSDAESFGNCSQVFSLMDSNMNGYVGLHEGIVALAGGVDVWVFSSNVEWQLKLQQINCSICLSILLCIICNITKFEIIMSVRFCL